MKQKLRILSLPLFCRVRQGNGMGKRVNDLNKKSVACSFGYTKKNIRLLREAIEKQDEGISHEQRQ